VSTTEAIVRKSRIVQKFKNKIKNFLKNKAALQSFYVFN